MTNGLPMGHRSFRPKWRSVCRTASIRGLARMGDPDASVIPAARDFREGHHAVATLHSSRSRFFQQKEYGRENYAIGGRDTMASFRFLSQIGVLYARTALVGCGATITCQSY